MSMLFGNARPVAVLLLIRQAVRRTFVRTVEPRSRRQLSCAIARIAMPIRPICRDARTADTKCDDEQVPEIEDRHRSAQADAEKAIAERPQLFRQDRAARPRPAF